MKQEIVRGPGAGPHLSPALHFCQTRIWNLMQVHEIKWPDGMGSSPVLQVNCKPSCEKLPIPQGMDQHFVSAESQVNMLPLTPAYSSACFPAAFLPFPCSALPSPLPIVHWRPENMLPRNTLALSSHRIPLQQGSVRLQPPEAAPCLYLSGRRLLTTRLLCKTGVVPQWVRNGWCKPSKWDFPRGMSAAVHTLWYWRSHR